MDILGKRLKPFWKEIILIICLHIITSVSLIMLPGYTSRMVDTGIQNQGFEYGLPLRINESELENLSLFFTDENRRDFQNSYQKINGFYEINEKILKDEDRAKDLENKLMPALAAAEESTRLQEADNTKLLEELEKGKDPQKVIQDFMPEIKDYPRDFSRSLAINYSISAYENTGFDVYEIQKSFLFKNGGIMLLIALIAFLSSAGAHFVSAHVGTRFGRSLRKELFERIINFSNNELSKFSAASLITRTTNDVQQVTFVLTMFLRAALVTPIISIAGVIMIMRSRPDMAWIMGSGIGILFIIIAVLSVIIVPAMQKIPKNLDNLNLVSRENLTGVQVIRAFGRQYYEERRFDEANANTRDNYLFIDRTMSLIAPVLIMVADLMGMLIIWVGGHKIAGGNMQIGQMMSFTAYSMRIFFSFLNLSMMATMVPRSIVCLKRIKEVLDTDFSVKNPENPIHLDNPEGLVEFDHVSFQFKDADEPVLKDLDFVARPGETTAIIGATGSGKSTVLNLIMRFVDATEGEIKIDGVNIKDMDQKELREMIGYVPQKGVLFSGTIGSNIGYGVENLDEKTMVKSAQIAHAEEFIEEKDARYDSRIAQGGSNVSGGQKQRLSIARAIAKNPKIYLFDDSFSALDYRTDKSLRKALAENVGYATVIIVAQRVSTIMDAENIIVLDNNRIESMGTHEELLENSEIYREIAESQLSEEELKGGNKHGKH